MEAAEYSTAAQAINDARRLVQHHASTVEPQLHALVAAALPAVDALRSQTAKDALSLIQVLPTVLRCCRLILHKLALEGNQASRSGLLVLALIYQLSQCYLLLCSDP